MGVGPHGIHTGACRVSQRSHTGISGCGCCAWEPSLSQKWTVRRFPLGRLSSPGIGDCMDGLRYQGVQLEGWAGELPRAVKSWRPSPLCGPTVVRYCVSESRNGRQCTGRKKEVSAEYQRRSASQPWSSRVKSVIFLWCGLEETASIWTGNSLRRRWPSTTNTQE